MKITQIRLPDRIGLDRIELDRIGLDRIWFLGIIDD